MKAEVSIALERRRATSSRVHIGAGRVADGVRPAATSLDRQESWQIQ